MNFNDISFKKCNGSEEDFLLLRKIHTTAMYNSVTECIGQWDDNFQKTRLENHYKEGYKTLEFIVFNDQVIGTINTRNKDYPDGQYQFIEQFYLLPQYQGKGLGGYLLNFKIGQNEVDTRLSVLKKDTKTHEFYFKNGFQEYHEDEYQKYLQRSLKNDVKNKKKF